MLKTLANVKIIALLAVIASGVGALVAYQAHRWSAERAREAERAAVVSAVCGTWTGEYQGSGSWFDTVTVQNQLYTFSLRPDGTATIAVTAVTRAGTDSHPIQVAKTFAAAWAYSLGQLYINGDQFAVSGNTMTCVAGKDIPGRSGILVFRNPLVMRRQGMAPAMGSSSPVGATPVAAASPARSPMAPQTAAPAPAPPASVAPHNGTHNGNVDFSAVERLLGD